MRVCLFSSYFLGEALSASVRRYLAELRRHFDRVVLITNDDNDLSSERDWLEANRIELRQVRNEGYDFGMWHKLLVPMPLEGLERLALVNDSCVLFAPLDEALGWMERSPHDACAMVDSQQHLYHLQSFFLYLKRPVIASVRDHFAAHGLATGGFWDVVHTYELGLSRHLAERGFSLGARYSVRGSAFRHNASMEYVEPLLRAGMPMIKRKAFRIEPRLGYVRRQVHQIINGYSPDPWNYVRLIGEKHGLPPAEQNALFGPLLQTDRFSRALNAAWRRTFKLYSALRLPAPRIESLGR